MLELCVARLQTGREQLRRHHSGFAFALLEQHRRVGRRDAHPHVAARGDRREKQPLRQRFSDDVAQLRVAHALLRQERSVGGIADLAVEPAGSGNLRDLGVDQPP